MSAYATRDRVVCALQGVKEATKRLCQKPNGKKKWWITYVSGYGTFEFGISDYYIYWPTTNTQTQSSSDQQRKLKTLLQRCEPLFDGTLGKWNGSEVDLELIDGAEPCHARAFPVPRMHLQHGP